MYHYVPQCVKQELEIHGNWCRLIRYRCVWLIIDHIRLHILTLPEHTVTRPVIGRLCVFVTLFVIYSLFYSFLQSSALNIRDLYEDQSLRRKMNTLATCAPSASENAATVSHLYQNTRQCSWSNLFILEYRESSQITLLYVQLCTYIQAS